PQGRRLSLGAVDADLLHQPRGQDVAQDAAHKAGAREGRAEAPIREGVTLRRPCERRDPYAAAPRKGTRLVSRQTIPAGGYGPLLSQGRRREGDCALTPP